ncbi:MAG TPA: efflux RND transporter periplasmic adaptor subunit [Burkholderiaceae bacterium]|nr:efflux RND transporter periplasmic adaptor subunit [Burkholderiaceae bacterium]
MQKSLRIPLLLVLVTLVAACGKKETTVAEERRPVYSVEVGASSGSVGATYSGVVQARYESKLGFQTSGKIVARLIEVGSRVKRGQALMRLDPAQETLHVVAAAAEVDAARSRVAQSRIDVQRTESLLARSFASQAELDRERLALAEAESQLQSALARQQIKLNQRGYTELVADRDGVVTAINAEAGQVVASGQPVVSVAADGDREVLVSIPESRVDELRRARTLVVSLWAHPGKTYHGALREMAPDTDSVTRTYSARIAVKDADSKLMLGMTASVFTPDAEGGSTIRLPLTAIYNKDGQPLVWVVDAQTSRVATRPVQLGGAQNDSVLVTGGLNGGETVVTAGVNMLHKGQLVAAVATAPNMTASVSADR